VLRVNDAVRIRVSFLASEACTGKEGKSDTNVSHIKQSLLQSAVPTTTEIPCCPVGGAILLLLPIKGPLEEGLVPEVILLLPEMGRDISYGRHNSKDLMECRLDGHGAIGSCRSNSSLNRGDSSPVASVELDQMNG